MIARRPLVYHPDCFVAALRQAHDTHAHFLAEMDELKREVAELRDIMQTVVQCSRETAERDVAALRHQLEVALARIQRRPDTPLH
jgi:hypothetical protein